MKRIFIFVLLILILGSCTRYFTPERYANPRHRYEIRTTKGERKMSRLMRRSTFHNSSQGCGYKK